MEKILFVILLSLAIAAPSGTASAATTPSANAANDSSHWLYLGAQLGDSVVGALLGLQFTKAYSLEFRYDYVDTVYQPNGKINASSTGAAVVGMFPVKFGDLDSFFIFAKGGYERTREKTTINDPGIPGLFPATTTISTTVRKRVTVGAGVQYDFTRDVSGRMGMNAVGSDHSVYLAAIYKF
ncbi:MAG: outer membrane beta-barrel protein [Nitrosomonadales bacterium]|nr:outer membrane beta-barrel protein [Nitrosomonadales bacterium]